MTLANPRPFPPFLLGNMRLALSRTDLSVRDMTGRIGGGSLGTDLWSWTGDFHALTDSQAVEIEAWLLSLDGSAVSFQAQDVRRWYPKMHPLLAGVNATASNFSVDTAGTTLTMGGLTAGTILSVGDMIGFKGGTGLANRHAVRVVEGATVAGGGSVTVEVRPAVWPNVVAWSSVVAHLDKPSITMRLTAETQISPTTPEGQMTAQIVAMQYLPPT